jgi:hypothetical protein
MRSHEKPNTERERDIQSMCLDPLLKSDFTDFMHKMYFTKNLRCLVGILENVKCILGQMHFAISYF